MRALSLWKVIVAAGQRATPVCCSRLQLLSLELTHAGGIFRHELPVAEGQGRRRAVTGWRAAGQLTAATNDWTRQNFIDAIDLVEHVLRCACSSALEQ